MGYKRLAVQVCPPRPDMNDTDHVASTEHIKNLIARHLQTGHMMQVATATNGQPWNCTVYYVPDEHLNLYWISTPERRHSKEIENNPKVAAAIPIQHIAGKPVIGLQVEGDARQVTDSREIQIIIDLYASRFAIGDEWRNDFIAGNNKHKIYCLNPRLFVLFDEEAFPGDARKEWNPII
jgi:uncharacterized protein YhbP (UPF0306 family)